MIDLTERVGAEPKVRGSNLMPGVQVGIGGVIPFEQADEPEKEPSKKEDEDKE